MKRLLPLLLSVCLLLGGCSARREAHLERPDREIPGPGAPLTLWVASDLHFLAPSLTDNGGPFLDLLARGDGTCTQYSAQIADAFIAEALAAAPDAVILSGDLTFNGAAESHKVLAEKLSVLEDAGIPVLVLPGNHDLSSPNAYRFEGETAYTVPSPDRAEFLDIYGGLGRRDALSVDEGSCSFLYPVSADLWVLALDANTPEAPGAVPSATLDWATDCLRRAEREGARVVTVTHQNLLEHNAMFSAGFVLRNASNVQELLEDSPVLLNFSGHMHVQHIQRSRAGLTDIASGSLSVFPNQYGVLELDASGGASYSTRSVDVSAWAAAQGEGNPDLLDFAAFSRAFFDRVTRAKTAEGLDSLPLTGAEREAMLDFSVEVNRHYFAGTMGEVYDELLSSPAWTLWLEKGRGAFFREYLMSVLAAPPGPCASLTLP